MENPPYAAAAEAQSYELTSFELVEAL